MTIAITGATGQLGRLVLKALHGRADPASVVALARDPAKATDLGVAVRAFDYSRPETLTPALAGVDTLLLISSSEIGRREAQHRAVIDAARDAGVGRIVYTSLLHADTTPLSLAAEHLATEAMLAQSGIPATILRNGWYTENQTGALAAAVEHGRIFGSEGDGLISAAARADYAEAAAVALTTEGHADRTYELAGDTAFTMADLAAEVARQSGRDMAFVNLPQADYARALAQFGLPGDLADAIADWAASTAKGALFDDGRQLSALIGRPTTPMAQTVAAALAG